MKKPQPMRFPYQNQMASTSTRPTHTAEEYLLLAASAHVHGVPQNWCQLLSQKEGPDEAGGVGTELGHGASPRFPKPTCQASPPEGDKVTNTSQYLE